jgi:hypothetical protein
MFIKLSDARSNISQSSVSASFESASAATLCRCTVSHTATSPNQTATQTERTRKQSLEDGSSVEHNQRQTPTFGVFSSHPTSAHRGTMSEHRIALVGWNTQQMYLRLVSALPKFRLFYSIALCECVCVCMCGG